MYKLNWDNDLSPLEFLEYLYSDLRKYGEVKLSADDDETREMLRYAISDLTDWYIENGYFEIGEE